jgi:hypothetical protein
VVIAVAVDVTVVMTTVVEVLTASDQLLTARIVSVVLILDGF